MSAAPADRIKATGSRQEVWDGTARHTSGRLKKEDLMRNSRGVIVSVKQSAAARERYPALRAKLCATPLPGAPAAPPLAPAAAEIASAVAAAVAPIVAAAAEVSPAVAAGDPDWPTLVYFGAGWDFAPVTNKDFQGIRRFVFIDALPNLAHYEPGMAGYQFAKDRESFVAKLKAEAAKKGYHLVSGEGRGNRLIFKTSTGGRVLEYRINTTVAEALDDPALSELIRGASWLHVKGYIPWNGGLRAARDMPNLIPNLADLRRILPARRLGW